MNQPSDMPLTVGVFGGVLTIQIGVNTLAFAIEQRPSEAFHITDCANFAHDVVSELEREEEDGTTPVHRLLDKAANEAFEQGSEHAYALDEPKSTLKKQGAK